MVQEVSNMSSDTQMALVPDRLNLAQLHQDHQPMPGTKIGNYILPKLHNWNKSKKKKKKLEYSVFTVQNIKTYNFLGSFISFFF